jgi:hypothetical protein
VLTCLSEGEDEKHAQMSVLLIVCVGHWCRGGVLCGGRALTRGGGERAQMGMFFMFFVCWQGGEGMGMLLVR